MAHALTGLLRTSKPMTPQGSKTEFDQLPWVLKATLARRAQANPVIRETGSSPMDTCCWDWLSPATWVFSEAFQGRCLLPTRPGESATGRPKVLGALQKCWTGQERSRHFARRFGNPSGTAGRMLAFFWECAFLGYSQNGLFKTAQHRVP